ncbi:MAG: cysteine desulfurase-like protein [Anaerolineae bacterium]|nr:MAG: cysteine desulfurase-like protein [Anaerolineae bacterium]
MDQAFDPHRLKRHFPSLQRIVNGKPAIYFDGPGGTQTPKEVIDAVSSYLGRSNANLGGAFTTSKESDEVVHKARLAIADFFNASGPEEIAFGQNMTSLTFAASRAISKTWQSGDEVIVTRLDHDANITPWVTAAQEHDVTVRWWDIRPEDCTLDIRELEQLVNPKTRLVAVTYASNATGTIVDVAKVSELAHQVGALVYVDAVHYAPHSPIDVQEIDCDFLAVSAYKFFGPHVGVFFGKYELLESIEAYKVRPAPKLPPGKWETGTQSFESLAGVTAAIEYLASIGKKYGLESSSEVAGRSGRPRHLGKAMRAIKGYEEGLSQYFLEQATAVPGLKVYGITDIERLSERTPTFAISMEGFTARQVAEYLAEQGIFVWDGHYYAVAVMERLGLLDSGGLVRIGLVHYNTKDEINRTIDSLRKLTSN